jgi:hypothetical protein
MANYNIRVLTNAIGLWPEGSEEAKLLLHAKATKTAELENIRGKLALRNQDISAAITHLHAANSFYKSAKISAVIFLLRVAPSSVVALFKLRGALLPSYHENAK